MSKKKVLADKKLAKSINQAARALQEASKVSEKKPFWKSKAVWLSLIVVAACIAEAFLNSPGVGNAAGVAAGVLNIVIRVLTTQSIR